MGFFSDIIKCVVKILQCSWKWIIWTISDSSLWTDIGCTLIGCSLYETNKNTYCTFCSFVFIWKRRQDTSKTCWPPYMTKDNGPWTYECVSPTSEVGQDKTNKKLNKTKQKRKQNKWKIKSKKKNGNLEMPKIWCDISYSEWSKTVKILSWYKTWK